MSNLRSLAKAPASLALLAAAAFAPLVRAQQQAPPIPIATHNSRLLRDSVTFAFERPGLSVPRFTLTLSDHADGHYHGEQSPRTARPSDPPVASQPFDFDFSVSSATASQIFRIAHDLHLFNTNCASNAKNIADTGKKTLSFSGREGSGSCAYNYSENKKVQDLTAIFLGIAETMDEGRRLDFLHRYDRLGLDAEMESFTGEVTAGRALELGTIFTSLSSLANDPEVMQRVRTRAAGLIARIPHDPLLETSGP